MEKIVKKYDRQITRILEILPPLLSWTLLTSPFWASFFIPEIIAYFIIVFDVYFVYKAGSLAINAVRSYRKIQQTKKVDWLAKLKEEHLPYQKVRHIVFVPTYKEPLEILQRTLTFLSEQEFPSKQIDVVIATEARDQEASAKVATLKKEFGAKFNHVWNTTHVLEPGEVVGKSSNLAASGRAIKEKVTKLGYDLDYLTATSCDADIAIHLKYFSCLTYQFLKHPERHLRFWQAALVFYNNLWRIPIFTRLVNTIHNISQVGELMRTKTGFNYSTYSLSWRLLDETDFWDVDVIPEDWHLFFKAFFAHKGRVGLEPIFLAHFGDAAEGRNYWQSLTSQYYQARRWAWGVTDIAYAIKKFMVHYREINLPNFSLRMLRALEQHILWPANWWLITLGATIPPLVNPVFKYTTLGYSLPQVSGFILTLATMFIVFIIAIDYLLRPPRPEYFKKRFIPVTILQYLLLPITAFLFNSLPGMDAHTRLLLGKRLEYKVTEKIGSK